MKSEENIWDYRSSFMQLLTVVLLIVILILAAIPLLTRNDGKFYPLMNKYQAVFLTNGRVYFGKVVSQDLSEIVMTNVYYLTVDQTKTTDPNQPAANVKMVKLSNELQSPEDRIILNRSVVGYVEDLKDSSQVVKQLEQGLVTPAPAVPGAKDQPAQPDQNTAPATNKPADANMAMPATQDVSQQNMAPANPAAQP